MISIVITWKPHVLNKVEELTSQACLDTAYEDTIRKFKSKRCVTLQDCINDFCREETLSENEKWYCSKCK
eukprot:UN27005